MPTGLYRRTRSDDPEAPHPVVVNEQGSRASSEQVRDYVFCSECERRFDQNGENYTLRLLSARNRFKLLEQLDMVRPSFQKLEWRGYKKSDSPNIDREQLGYFALSIFWRASAHTWRWKGGKPVRIHLGAKNNEALRQYLLGQAGVPDTISLFLIVCTDKFTQESFYLPTLSHKKNFSWTYGFVARGLFFNLTVAKQPAQSQVDTCCLRSFDGWIWVRDCEGKTLEGFHDLMARQPPDVRGRL
jgi:hypothetical protein